jgi:NAD(P)-dependent dehydrogenase (short-subunit alcohol dehydrogenase family)
MTSMNSTAPQSSRIVAVTGAGTGIGRATARAFAAEGARVVAIGRRAEPLKETAAGHDRITPLARDPRDGADPGEAGLAHEPLDPLAADVDALALQDGMDSGRSVDPAGVLVDLPDLPDQLGVLAAPFTGFLL